MPAYRVSNGMRKSATNPPWTALQRAFITVIPATVVMILMSCSGLFSTVTTELGLGHYAEKRPSWFPEFLPMPLNTIINVGYTLCGLHWCFFIAEANRSGIVKCNDAFLFFAFNTMGCLYGFVQLYRILFQTQSSAVIDQWYTLPFFMLVFVWAETFRGKCSQQKCYKLMLASVSSYLLTLFTSIGFEIALGCHILIAVTGAVLLYSKYPSEDTLQYIVLAILSCTGFVVLKLLDHHLVELHWIFSYISGHFLSKICDILQFHFVNEFFFGMIFNKVLDPASIDKFKMR